MTTLSLRLPNSLHRQLRELAKAEGISMNQLITLAIAEKLSAPLTVAILQQRAARGDRRAFEQAMTDVPDVEPEESNP